MVITEENGRSVGSGYGLQPKYLKETLDKSVNIDLEKGVPFSIDYVG